MSRAWEALGARARGLGAHLLSEEKLSALGRLAGPADFVRELTDTAYEAYLPRRGWEPGPLEAGVTRSLAERLSTLAGWAGPKAELLTPIVLEQDARNVRGILRGVSGELTPAQRVAGAIPTPTLGRRSLETLARAESPGAVAATLVTWGHPLGPPLLEQARRTHPDLFRLEAALVRFLAEHVVRTPRRRGEGLRHFVTESVDARNLVTSVLLVGARFEGPVAEAYAHAGGRLDRRAFVKAASAADRVQAAEVLVRAMRGTVFERALKESPATPAGLAQRILEARIGKLARDSRREPLTSLPVLLYLLRLRREAALVRRALWTSALQRRSPL